MSINRPARSRGHRGAPDITLRLAYVDFSEHPVHVVEGGLILRFLLAPNQFGSGMLGATAIVPERPESSERNSRLVLALLRVHLRLILIALWRRLAIRRPVLKLVS
jgi:hypothetical protein